MASSSKFGNVPVFDTFFFNDEAWFHLDSYINTQNYRVWSSKNLHAFQTTSLHPQKIGLWCAMSDKLEVGSIFFFEIMITAEVYHNIIQ